MHRIGDIAFAVVILAGAYVVTRKNSKAGQIITATTAGFADVIRGATGQHAGRR